MRGRPAGAALLLFARLLPSSSCLRAKTSELSSVQPYLENPFTAYGESKTDREKGEEGQQQCLQ